MPVSRHLRVAALGVLGAAAGHGPLFAQNLLQQAGSGSGEILPSSVVVLPGSQGSASQLLFTVQTVVSHQSVVRNFKRPELHQAGAFIQLASPTRPFHMHTLQGITGSFRQDHVAQAVSQLQRNPDGHKGEPARTIANELAGIYAESLRKIADKFRVKESRIRTDLSDGNPRLLSHHLEDIGPHSVVEAVGHLASELAVRIEHTLQYTNGLGKLLDLNRPRDPAQDEILAGELEFSQIMMRNERAFGSRVASWPSQSPTLLDFHLWSHGERRRHARALMLRERNPSKKFEPYLIRSAHESFAGVVMSEKEYNAMVAKAGGARGEDDIRLKDEYMLARSIILSHDRVYSYNDQTYAWALKTVSMAEEYYQHSRPKALEERLFRHLDNHPMAGTFFRTPPAPVPPEEMISQQIAVSRGSGAGEVMNPAEYEGMVAKTEGNRLYDSWLRDAYMLARNIILSPNRSALYSEQVYQWALGTAAMIEQYYRTSRHDGVLEALFQHVPLLRRMNRGMFVEGMLLSPLYQPKPDPPVKP